MRRLRIAPIATVFTLSACLTEPIKCPAGFHRMSGPCVQSDNPDEDGGADATTDDAAPQDVCYLDYDHDGVGSAEEVDCDDPFAGLPASPEGVDASDDSDGDAGETADAAGPEEPPSRPAISDRNDDCDDHDPNRSPLLKELCDGLDNNCNDESDDNATNACGGACTRVLDHAPGDTCENGQSGACARTGKYICQGNADVVCSAPQITPSSEICGDNLDNDCDGVTDEPDAVNAPHWYQDCDGDGYAASTAGSIQSCAKPANAGACGWTQVIPQQLTRTNWDCNDASDTYKPTADYALPPEGFSSWDINCDGTLTPHPAPPPDVFVCSEALITRLNVGDDCDPIGDYSLSGCTVWTGSSGKYSSSPASKCPDANLYRVTILPHPVDPGSSYCTVQQLPAAWPCR